MPTLAELAQMSDGDNSGAYVGYPQLQRQAARMRLSQMGRIPENLADPRTYGFMSGLLGTSPDELGMSVLSPNTTPAKDAAYYGYQLSNLGQIAPAMMPATKAALRTVGNAINDAMVYGTGPLARITPQPMRLDTYHGTPHSFNQFDASKIGTGEGAQSYGHGIYVAENPEVAKRYQYQLAPERNAGDLNTKVGYIKIGDKPINPDNYDIDIQQELVDAAKLGKKEFLNFVNQRKTRWQELSKDESYPYKGTATQRVNEYNKLIIDAKDLGVTYTGSGNFYKINLPDEMIPTMLDWDKPLNQQSKHIQDAMKKIGMPLDKTGKQAYEGVTYEMGRQKGSTKSTVVPTNPVEASKFLKEAGITGIKYLDEGSRKPGVTSMTQAQLDNRINILKKDINSGLGNQDRMKQILSALEAERASHSNLTSNFVVFPGNEHLLKIQSRNGQPIK